MEINGLFSLEELKEYYMEKISEGGYMGEVYRLLMEKTMLDNGRWIPGFIEKLFDEKRVYVKVVDEYEQEWIETLKLLFEPYIDVFMDKFRNSGWNDLKTRPIGFEKVDEGVVIKVEPTTYFYSFLTNFRPDFVMGKARTVRDVLEPYVLSGSVEGVLKSIEESRSLPVSNDMGISVLLVTSDGKVLLTYRGTNVMIERNKFAHTVSGAVDWSFVLSKKDLFDAVELLFQELGEKEEFGVYEKDKYQIYPVVMARNLRYLGKPEMMFIGYIDMSSNDLMKTVSFGRYLESIGAVSVDLGVESIVEKTKCGLLDLVVEKLVLPLIYGDGVDVFMDGKKVRLDYDRLASNLLIGLYSYGVFWERYCG